MSLMTYTYVHLLSCCPVSKKLLLTSQLDHQEEPEQKNHIQALLILALPLGLCLSTVMRKCSMAVLLAFTASKYQWLFKTVLLGRISLAVDPQLPSIWNVGESSTALWGSWLAESQRAEFGAERPNPFSRSACLTLLVTAKAGQAHLTVPFFSLPCRLKREVKRTPCLPSCGLVTKWWTSMRWNWAAPEERPSPWLKGPTRNWSWSSAGRQDATLLPSLPGGCPSCPPRICSWKSRTSPGLGKSLVLGTQAWAQGQVFVLFS